MTMPTVRAAEILRDFAPLSPGDSITLNWEEANALFDAARRGVEAEGAIGNLKTACEVSNRVAHERAERAEAENKTLIAYRKHDQNTIEFLNGVIARKIKEYEAALDAAVAREAAKQAKIDALMLEYCPDEMTQEQIANWASHQKPSPDQPEHPSTADDEATRWRHGEPTDTVMDWNETIGEGGKS